jgi:methionine synthase II (cobalamin-independent)
MSEKFQIVGSLLRPQNLLAYKSQIEKRDDIQYPFYNDFEGYQACETQAIQDVIQKQIDHKLSIISDGEFSKSLWHLDFVWGLKGVRRLIAEHGYFSEISTKRRPTKHVVILRQLSMKNSAVTTTISSTFTKKSKQMQGTDDKIVYSVTLTYLRGMVVFS